MDMVAPAGPMYQAGTLSGNPLAMTAGKSFPLPWPSKSSICICTEGRNMRVDHDGFMLFGVRAES